MNRNRIIRLLVCLLVVCCLLVQVSPIRARALFLADDLAIGYAALLILATAGIIFCPETAKQVTAIGNSMKGTLREWGEATENSALVEAWIAGVTIYDASSSDGDDPIDKKVALARGILAGIATWVCSVALNLVEIQTEEECEVGFAYYNGVLLPDIDLVWTDKGTYPYAAINYNVDSGLAFLSVSNGPFYYDYSGQWLYTYTSSASSITCQMYICNTSDTSWSKSTTYYSTKWTKLLGTLPHWTNYQVVQYGGSEVYLEATEPVDYLTTILCPETYVGDIPQKIQDGEVDEETLVLPDINYAPLLQEGLSTEESLLNTMQQLKEGTLTYDDFMEQIKVETETETDTDATEDPSEDPSTDTGTDSDTWTPPSDPNAFALDLTNYFPFCIPFDLFEFLSCLNADPVAPVIEWEIALSGGGSYPIELDLSPFDSVATLLRRLQLLLFIIGLAVKTRDLIKG